MLTLEKAHQITQKALAKAAELGLNVTVAVVDHHGAILCVQRMEKSFPVSHEFAQAKAATAAVFGMATGDIGKYAVPGQPYYGITSALGGKFMVMAGGLPITEGKEVVGGIGVGGSADVSQDVACAQAGLE